jgi:hypothetical protein
MPLLNVTFLSCSLGCSIYQWGRPCLISNSNSNPSQLEDHSMPLLNVTFLSCSLGCSIYQWGRPCHEETEKKTGGKPSKSKYLQNRWCVCMCVCAFFPPFPVTGFTPSSETRRPVKCPHVGCLKCHFPDHPTSAARRS